MSLLKFETKEISLRPYQADAIEALRENIRQGRKRIILCAGTGAGKTLTAAKLLKEAYRKESYSLFVVDRVALVDQTSAVFDEYGIPHGVVQGINDRWAPHEHVQVCSAQTLGRRSLPRVPSLIVVDEAHCRHKATLDLMAANPQAVCIGLTATPFTKGMGQDWGGIVNVRSTRLLIGDGHLVEPTIYVARSPEDSELGLNSYGEFSDSSASTAGIRIIGDVVSEWVAKTHEHFSGPVKTIVFSPTVEHGRELCAAFAAAGYNFQQISYLDRDDAARAEKIAEFRRPDSIIHGLVSCGVLTKGFDVPDCLCIASGQRVLTDKGLVPIEKVTIEHRLWDGIEYVEHQGLVFKGYQDVIEYAGLTATAGHEVHTAKGWRTLGDCAAEQIGITQTGFGGRPIRWDAGFFAGGDLAKEGPLGSRSRHLPMRDVRGYRGSGFGSAQDTTPDLWLSRLLFDRNEAAARGSAGVAHPARQQHEITLRKVVTQGIFRLRRTWDRISVSVCAFMRGMGRCESWLATAGQQYAVGSHRQQWTLRAWQPAVGIQGPELQQYPSRWLGCNDASVSDRTSRDTLCRQDAAELVRCWTDIRSGSGEVLHAIRQTKRPVWDILQAGPRNRFTCEGLLVHNCGVSCKPYRKSLSSHMQEIGRVMRSSPGKDKCLWLDHSGNVERFAADMFDVWENGAGELDTAEKRDAVARKREEVKRDKPVCPECNGLLRGTVCMACGWERPARSGIVAVAGTLEAFDASGLRLTPRDGLRAECLKDPRRVWDGCLAYAMDRCPRDEQKARRWAYGIWAGIYAGTKLPRGWFDVPKPLATPDAYALAEREVARFRKRRAA